MAGAHLYRTVTEGNVSQRGYYQMFAPEIRIRRALLAHVTVFLKLIDDVQVSDREKN